MDDGASRAEREKERGKGMKGDGRVIGMREGESGGGGGGGGDGR